MVNMSHMPAPLIKPFKGLLYNHEKVGDIARCVCPPYDVIPDPSPYYERSPYNTIRLELPVEAHGLNKYENAKRTLDTWLGAGVLSFDREDSIYLCEQEFVLNGVVRKRTGFIPLVRLDRERILTHEETRKRAREDRERLIETTGTFTSLIFAMYEDEPQEVARLMKTCDKERLHDFTDEFAIRNRFFRMRKPEEMARLSLLMEGKELYVADGHHRLSVSYKLGLPYVAIFLTDMNADGIAILPYHRVVRQNEKQEVGGILEALKTYFDVSEVPGHDLETLRRLAEDISASPTLSFLLYFSRKAPLLLRFDQKEPFDFDPESHEILRRLRVNAIHAGVLKHLLGVADEEISFSNDPEEAMKLVDEGGGDFAVFVPGTSVREVKDIAENHLYMPPKSTYFYPKVTSGLVFYKYA
jgi:uncharacterized protein (DUF1015 family)